MLQKSKKGQKTLSVLIFHEFALTLSDGLYNNKTNLFVKEVVLKLL